ncbi:hypothetical protein AB205_0157550, partial [Aquarana catesbeiana]
TVLFKELSGITMECPSGLVCIIIASILLMNMSCIKATGDRCQLSADISELKRHFEAIKGFLHDGDIITDISLVRESMLNKIHVSEQCCFLLKLGRFYLGNVFPNIELSHKNINDKKRSKLFHNLANAVLGLKTELRQCHSTMRCPCGEKTLRFIEEFKREFYELETEAATRKAVGDLNILFRWMERKYMG